MVRPHKVLGLFVWVDLGLLTSARRIADLTTTEIRLISMSPSHVRSLLLSVNLPWYLAQRLSSFLRSGEWFESAMAG